MRTAASVRQAARHNRRRARLLRPAGFDDLGLRRAISDRLLPFLVAAMSFLALLALAAAAAASALALHWQQGAGSTLTVQVPRPLDHAAAAEAATATAEATRQAAVLAALRATPGVAAARALSEAELADLLRPWLGEAGLGESGLGGAGLGEGAPALPLPGVIEVRLNGGEAVPEGLAARLTAIAPEVLVESHGIWLTRLAVLARSLQACAALTLLVVVAVAVAVVSVATRAGLSARREAIDIVHGLGAADGYIAGRFATRATVLAGSGGLAGALAGLPLLLGLAQLAAPFTAAGATVAVAGPGPLAVLPPEALMALLPAALWLTVPALPLAAAAIGWLTAQVTVRRWLLRLP